MTERCWRRLVWSRCHSSRPSIVSATVQYLKEKTEMDLSNPRVGCSLVIRHSAAVPAAAVAAAAEAAAAEAAAAAAATDGSAGKRAGADEKSKML